MVKSYLGVALSTIVNELTLRRQRVDNCASCPAEAPWRKLMRVPNLQVMRNLKNGDARKRIPPSKGWPRVTRVGPFVTFFAE